MRLYVASKWENRPRVKEVMAQLQEAGHIITFDWTDCDQFSREQALKDYMGVMNADALVFVAERDFAFKGAYVELGMACARGISCYILGTLHGTGIDKCIFLKLPNVQTFTSLEHLIDFIPTTVLP